MISLVVAGGCQAWPLIRPVKGSRRFDISKSGDTPLVLMIRSRTGDAVYKLECHNGDYDDTSEMNFSGDFQCALFALSSDCSRSTGNLLATDEKDEQTSDWYNRGRMTSGQLVGDCGENPDYGRVRRFKLRGMSIVFKFEGLTGRAPRAGEGGGPRVAAFTFGFSVVDDGDARSSVANRVTTPRPPLRCYQ